MRTIAIGQITRPHGLRGWVKVQLFWSQSEALFEAEKVLLAASDASSEWVEIEDARPANKAVLLKLRGIDDCDRAEALRGREVSVERETLGELAEGEYYLCDLIGAKVTVAGVPYGEVVEVRTHPTLDAIVVRTLAGTVVEQPLTPPWLTRVDVQEGVVELENEGGVIA